MCARVRICLDSDAGRRSIVRTNPDGSWRFEGLPPDGYELTALFDDAGGGTFFMESRRVTLGDSQRTRVDFMDALSISGVARVGDPPAPLAAEDAGVELSAWKEGEKDSVSLADCDAGGAFTLWVPGPGVTSSTAPRAHALRRAPGSRVDLTSGRAAEGVEFLDRDEGDGAIRIAVLDAETGEPVAEGDYEYRWKTTMGAGSFEGAVVEQSECGLGAYRFTIEAEGYAE